MSTHAIQEGGGRNKMNETHQNHVSDLTISVMDETGYPTEETIVGELTWEKLWETLALYDENKSGRDRKKFYIVVTKRHTENRVI